MLPGVPWSVELSLCLLSLLAFIVHFHGHPTLLLRMAKAASDCTNEQSRKIPLLLWGGHIQIIPTYWVLALNTGSQWISKGFNFSLVPFIKMNDYLLSVTGFWEPPTYVYIYIFKFTPQKPTTIPCRQICHPKNQLGSKKSLVAWRFHTEANATKQSHSHPSCLEGPSWLLGHILDPKSVLLKGTENQQVLINQKGMREMASMFNIHPEIFDALLGGPLLVSHGVITPINSLTDG